MSSAYLEPVLDWYAACARDLPWRAPGVSPWAVLVSEIMLQQTPVSRVLPAYQAWLERWPTPAALAADPAGEAVRQWGRLGYPRRALRLHETATIVTERYAGQLPSTRDELLALPGIGAYTAAAVAVFAFGRRHAVLDTNVRRVLTRLGSGREFPGAQPSTAEYRFAESLLPQDHAVAARWSVAVMELGALTCTAAAPRCDDCPVATQCAWLAAGRPAAEIRPVGQRYEGTDRQCRGRLLGVLRDSPEPVPLARFDLVWPDDTQRARALDGLVTDGLVDPLPDGRFALPGPAPAKINLLRRAWRRPARRPGTERTQTHTFRMWMDSDRGEDGEDGYDAAPDPGVRDPDAYWRRRFFILGGGVAVIGLCVWLFPGGHPPAARTSASARASMAALDRRGELPPAAYGSPWPAPTPKKTVTASAVATASAKSAAQRTAAAGGHPHASPSPTATPTPTQTPSASASAVKGPRCAPSGIVLSLFTSQGSYGQDAAPKFDVYAVSTSSAACTFRYGPGSVQVVVTSRGRVVWESAACKPPAAPAVRFTLGVPQVFSVSWNRRATAPEGCAGTLPAGASGTFDVVATADGQSSQVRSFTLSR